MTPNIQENLSLSLHWVPLGISKKLENYYLRGNHMEIVCVIPTEVSKIYVTVMVDGQFNVKLLSIKCEM